MKKSPAIAQMDSINYLQPAHRGHVVLAGSHGGLYSGYKAVSAGVRAVVLNDAGVGLEAAGIASLAYAEPFGLAVATVDSRSARIGDGADMRSRGVVSHVNAHAKAAGVSVGMRCEDALALLCACPAAIPDASHQDEYRRELYLGVRRVVCIDSASLIQPGDAGEAVLTGSHGGLIGGNPLKAINVAAGFVAFNDAGGGADDAGLGRLAPLQERGIPAVTVAHTTARIGDAMSTYETGVISHANPAALALGARVGSGLRQFLQGWLAA